MKVRWAQDEEKPTITPIDEELRLRALLASPNRLEQIADEATKWLEQHPLQCHERRAVVKMIRGVAILAASGRLEIIVR